MDTVDVAVVGLGFTGLATAVSAAQAGFRVVGLDSSADRVRQIVGVNPGCGLHTVREQELRGLLAAGRLRVLDTSRPRPAAGVHVLCVPTPAGGSAGADLTPLLDAADSVADILRRGDLVVVQSTCPPDTVERLVLPRLAGRSGLSVGTGFHLAYSPVRIDQGVRTATLRNVPRVVAGATPACTDAAVRFLHRLTDHVHPVSTIQTAELVKVFENTFRLVNVSLVNELTALCRESRLDTAEILAAAATKPYGFLGHHPSAGAGGDCVPVSAGFFAAAARRHGVPSAVVDAAVALNDAMPGQVLRRIRDLLAEHGLPPLRDCRILVVGLTYKPDVANVRRSAAVAILEQLRSAADVGYHDPYVPRLTLADGTVLHSQAIEEYPADLVLVLTAHRVVSDTALTGRGAPVIDCATGEPRLLSTSTSTQAGARHAR